MGAPHNKDRYGEVANQIRIDCCLWELEYIKDYIVLSGGWAWHFMSPEGHVELKHAHDHKDIDIFIEPKYVGAVVSVLKSRGFEKVWTRYDGKPLKIGDEFRRYEKVVEFPPEQEIRPVRITIDFFVGTVETRLLDSGWTVVKPEVLLTYYSSIHSSDACFAVQAASKLVAQGIDPVGRPELVEIPNA